MTDQELRQQWLKYIGRMLDFPPDERVEGNDVVEGIWVRAKLLYSPRDERDFRHAVFAAADMERRRLTP